MPLNPDVSRLRVAVVSDAAPERNGVGAYYKDLVDHLLPRVREVTLYSPTIVNEQWISGFSVPLPGDATQKLCFPNFFRMRADLKRQQPDVMIVATPGVYGMYGAFLATRWQIPVITGFHTSLEQLTDLYWQNSLTGRFFRFYLENSHRYLFDRSKKVLANSQDMYDLAIRMGTENVQLMGTPIPASFTQPVTHRYDGQLRRILFAGRLAAEKNIAAVITTAEQHPELSFSIAGDGPERETIEAAAARLANVTYLGWLDRNALLATIDDHDALVLPSFFESFGTIALEAMARERPVIVSGGAGISNWTELSGNILIINEGSSLSAAVGELEALPAASRQQRASAARDEALAFNESNIRAWEVLLADVTRH